MQYFLKKLSPDDGQDVYNMLQQIPAEENGFVNPAHGMEYIAFQTWLTNCDLNSKKTGLEDGWRVPASIFWLYVDGKPVGIGKLRHFLTAASCRQSAEKGMARSFYRSCFAKRGKWGSSRHSSRSGRTIPHRSKLL